MGVSKKGTRYQTKARALLYEAGAVNVLTCGGTGYAGGVDLLAFFPDPTPGVFRPLALAVQVKACHQDRAGRNGATNKALRAGVLELKNERLPTWVRREVWVFRRGGVVKRAVDVGRECPP